MRTGNGVVIGGGTMGADIAGMFVAQGRDVQVVDGDAEVRKRLPGRVQIGFGFRYVAAGLLLQKDLAGVDTHCAAAATMYPYLCNDTEVSPLMRKLVAANKLGVKSKQGFYKWDDASILAAQTQYKSALRKALAILRDSD
jgi:3-hydroxyacyl-CoA dehydrogenase